MKVLYYLEPFCELGNPLFRMGTVRNHLDNEIRSLRASQLGPVECVVVCSTDIAAEVRRGGYLEGVALITVEQSELKRVYPDYLEASYRWYERSFDSRARDEMASLISEKLKGFVPDVINCYESNAPFLEYLFPRALFLNNTLGIFSRAPYPETSCLDPFGVGKHAFLKRFAADIHGFSITREELRQIESLKHVFQEVVLDHSPVRRDDVRKGFESVLLLPLQVSRYFMFDCNGPECHRFRSQLDLLKYVLETVDPGVGIFVTMHGAEANLMTESVLDGLKKRHPNILHDPDLQRVRWVSQYALPHVDGVATVSSSVGLQTLLWNLPVFAVGQSHIAGISDTEHLEEANAYLTGDKQPKDKDGALFYLLTHYYPLIERYHHNPEWHYRFLERGVEKRLSGELDFAFFEPIDEPERIFDALKLGVRIDQMRLDLQKTARHLHSRSATKPSSARQGIAEADVVSFDVFDTLITRTLSDPKAVFDLVEIEQAELIATVSSQISAFGRYRDVRQRAASMAMEQASANGAEEFTFREIFAQMRHLTGISQQVTECLASAELEIERRLHHARRAGVELLAYARELNKRVVFVSDMYLDAEFIKRLLQESGVPSPDELYASSEWGLLKRSGRLYRLVRDREGKNLRYFHIGDSYHSDVLMARQQGFRAEHLPNPTQNYLSSATGKQLWKTEDVSQSPGGALMHGAISRKFYDHAETTAESWCASSAYRLGYEAAGPVVLGFVKWILESAKRDEVERLYFLARDGYLVKQVYDLATQAWEDAPSSHYLLASRRALNTPAMTTEHDVLSTLSSRFSVAPLRDILWHRFAMREEDVVFGSVRGAGFFSLDDKVDITRRDHRERFKALLSLNSSVILKKAADEREPLLAYLKEERLTESGTRFIVDIGHNATLQKSIGRLLDDQTIGGYYFATFYGAKAVYNLGHPVSAYLMNFEDHRDSHHPYCRNIGMFEFLFLPALPSFMRMQRALDGRLVPEYVKGDEHARFAIIEEVHRGVIDFCHDVLQSSGTGGVEAFELPTSVLMRRYTRFVSEPYKKDAEMLSGVSFVDAFGGSTNRYLIATPEYPRITDANFDLFVRKSWWRPGARVLAKGRKSVRQSRDNGIPKGGHLERKLRKLEEDPWGFVVDMRILRPLRPQLHRWAYTHDVAIRLRNASAFRKAKKLFRNPVGFVKDMKIASRG